MSASADHRCPALAGIARRAGDEDALESRFAQDARVGHAVERDAAAEAEIGKPSLAAESASDVDER